MKLEIDIPEHHYNNIMAFDSVRLGRLPYKGIIMYAIKAIKHGKVLEQEPVLDKLRAEIAEYGSIWVEYKITGRRDKDIEQLVGNVLSQAKEQVLEVIDKYRGESEVEDGNDD